MEFVEFNGAGSDSGLILVRRDHIQSIRYWKNGTATIFTGAYVFQVDLNEDCPLRLREISERKPSVCDAKS